MSKLLVLYALMIILFSSCFRNSKGDSKSSVLSKGAESLGAKEIQKEAGCDTEEKILEKIQKKEKNPFSLKGGQTGCKLEDNLGYE